MKRLIWIGFLVLLFSLPAYSQFWIHFEWNAPMCRECRWMEQTLHLSPWAAKEYHKIIHKYGRKIEHEALKDCRYWDHSAQIIYRLRMERDRKLQRILSPRQFELYVYYIRETPQRIHDYIGWYNNPHYPNYHPTRNCYWYEDSYWRGNWTYAQGNWVCHFDAHGWYPGKYSRPTPPPPPHKPAPRPPHHQPVRPEKPVAPRPPVGRPVPPAHEGRPSGRPEKPSKGPSYQQDKDHKKDHPSKGSSRYSGHKDSSDSDRKSGIRGVGRQA